MTPRSLKAVNSAFFGEAYANLSPKEATERYLREVRSEYLFGADSLGFSAKELEDMKSEMTLFNHITYHDDHIITMQKDVYTYSAGAAHGLPATGNIPSTARVRTSSAKETSSSTAMAPS